MKKYLKVLILSTLIAVSSLASAEYSIPKSQADTDQKAYLNAIYAVAPNNYYVWFWEPNEQLVRSFTQNSSTGYTNGIYYYSDYTKIATSYFTSTTTYKMRFICPTGQSDKVKRHINIMKSYDINVGIAYETYPACPTAPTQPKPNLNTSTITNSTTISQIQSLYPLYAVSRIYAARDLFKVECLQTSCDSYHPWISNTGEIWYLSNTNAIGHKDDNYSNDLNNYVRVPESIANQTAKDDIAFLSSMYFGNYVTWVYDSTIGTIRWW